MDAIFEGLNPEQRQAVLATRGPVCILAGAGTGKTTTITRRIAYQIASGAFPPSAILAVTFTDKAAGELRERLARLGVPRVNARTFHSAALAQLRALAPDPPGRILPSKALLLRQIANGLPKPFRFRPAADLATEIEWAKNRRLSPPTYADGLGPHRPPVPEDVMERVFAEYERRKAAHGAVDFEDLLELAVRLYEADERAAERFRARYHAFTVDEFQDVNLLQQTLLDCWLGGRDELCAVGDDLQSIYGFTGATPRYLLELPERFPAATVVRLGRNYRSSAQVLELANRLGSRAGTPRPPLRATQPDGPEPVLRSLPGHEEEVAFVVESARRLHEAGVPWEEIAVLYRINARSEELEEAFAAAHVPFQVRSGAFLTRPAARRLLGTLRRTSGTDVLATVRRRAVEEGLLEVVPDGLGEAETTRQLDLRRFVRLAEEFDDGRRTVADFVADLERRVGAEGDARGVQLLTLHRAKGLEFEAVFLPRVEERELPIRQACSSDAAVAEERRLLYVGLTRAKRHLAVTWAGQPSRFLAELGVTEPERRPARGEGGEPPPGFAALREWRRRRASADGVPAYVVFHDRTLEEIAARRPRTEHELATVAGVGPAKLERYGADVLAALARDASS